MNQQGQELIKRLKQHGSAQPSVLSLSAKAAIKKQIFSNLYHKPVVVENNHVPSWTFTFTRIAVTAMSILVLLTGTTYASFSALPGDTLYPLKRTMEDTRVKFATSPENKAKLQIQFAEKRLQELEILETKDQEISKIQTLNQNHKDVPITSPVGALVPTPNQVTITELEPEESPKEKSAKQEISKAIQNLERTKTQLQQTGNSDEALNLSTTIRVLTDRVEKRRKRRAEPKETTKSDIPSKDARMELEKPEDQNEDH